MGSSVSSVRDASVTSTRYATESSVKTVVDNLAFIPPARSTEQLNDLKKSNEHFFASNLEYNISSIVCRPTVPKKSNINSCILFAHGNGSDIINMRYMCLTWANTWGMDCVCFDYIGYGLSQRSSSTGTNESASEKGCYTSIEIVMDILEKNYQRIYLVGQSLGTGVVVDYCAKTGWTHPIVLISPYKSIVLVMFDSSLSSGIDSSFNTIEKVPKLKCPVKIFHGRQDALIGVDHGERIFNTLPNKSLDPVWFDNAGHNDILYYIKYNHLCDVFNL